ncbi:MAG: hypothetical protein WDO69_08485 [Pseudomonadota bacterium]
MARTQSSRTPLSRQAGVLRTSLLLSLGLSPLACGGTAITASSGDGGSTAQAGTGDAGGAPARGGSPTTEFGAGSGGVPSYGGLPSVSGAPSYGGGSGGTNPATICANPVFNSVTKLVECSSGREHRAESLACTFTVPPPSAAGAGGAGDAGAAGAADALIDCDSDADCTALPNGYCETPYGNVPYRRCQSGCIRDSDCGSGACACNGTNPGRCIGAGCWTDADCGPNSLCALADGVCGPGSFQCTSPNDQCVTGADCPSGTCMVFNGIRTCNGPVCGRPFLIAESPRMAPVEARADWLDATLAPNPSGLTPVQRAQLAAHWARLGQMEHASIAAFARFNLQLLSLGAPSALIEACNRALADETAHTRLCFALASAYGGAALGPARLDVEHCFEGTSLTAIAKLVLREGCLGETVASLEALAAAEIATDPAVKQALTRIAKDELSHAELAFAFLRWALSLASAEARHEIAREAARQLADFESNARSRERERTDERLAAHGLIAGDALRAIHLAAVRDVTRPLLAALFDAETSNNA